MKLQSYGNSHGMCLVKATFFFFWCNVGSRYDKSFYSPAQWFSTRGTFLLWKRLFIQRGLLNIIKLLFVVSTVDEIKIVYYKLIILLVANHLRIQSRWLFNHTSPFLSQATQHFLHLCEFSVNILQSLLIKGWKFPCPHYYFAGLQNPERTREYYTGPIIFSRFSCGMIYPDFLGTHTLHSPW